MDEYKEPPKLALRKTATRSYHSNFVNLTPVYEARRAKLISDVAASIAEIKRLEEMKKEEDRLVKEFAGEIRQEGGKLSYK